MIVLDNISKTFKDRKNNVEAVKNVSLTIDDGEIFGIIGFSGAGKSTLVRCINLLERVDEGKVIIDGVNIVELDEKQLREVRKNIGMIFQNFNLLKARTVYDNIAYPMGGSSREEKDKKIRELLKLVGLEDKINAYPNQLSGGQKQRVAIARALATNPKYLLCDEATSALDPQTTSSILKLLKQINRELGVTIIIITHEMAVIKQIADRVAVMQDGRVVEINDAVSIFSEPQQQITRDFVNSTGNISKVYELIENNSVLTQLKENEELCIFSYVSGSAGKPLISQLSRTYDIDINVIYGNIEVINDIPIGRLVVKISGQKEKIAQAIEHISSENVEVEVIRTC